MQRVCFFKRRTAPLASLRDRMASGDLPPGASIIVGANGNLYALLPSAERTIPARALAQTGLRGEPALLPAARPELLSDGPLAHVLLAQMLQQRQQQQEQEQQRLALQQLEQILPRAIERDEPSSSALNSLLQASILQALQGQSGAGAPPSAPAPQSRAPAAPAPRRQAARDVDSASMSGSESPPPSRSHDRATGTLGAVSAKEKNRQAQRRFRERQKDLIASLKSRVESLHAKVLDNEKEIIALKEENAMLRGRVEGKLMGTSGGGGHNVTLPAEALQSLLQMTAGSGGGGGLGAAGPSSNGGGGGGAGAVGGLVDGSGKAFGRVIEPKQEY